VRVVEAVVGLLFVAGGVRSAVWWWRRPFAAVDVADHLLYALFLTGRVGMWFAFAGLFAIYASLATRGQAFVDDVNDFRWYVMVFVALGAMQLVGGQILSRRTPGIGARGDDEASRRP
jgi:hypothetical protein